MRKIILAVVVLVLAGIVGVFLMDKPIAEYIRNPYYRNALELEKEFPFIDVVGFSNNGNEISIGIVFLEGFEEEEGDRLTRWLNYVAQKRSISYTKLFSVWVLTIVEDRVYANGLWTVNEADLHSDGVTDETMKASEVIYFRWLMGTPIRFNAGVWPWTGR